MSEPIHPPVVIDTSQAPHARLTSVPVSAVQLTGGFWDDRRRVLREVTLPTMYQRLEETARIDNFRRAAGKRPDLSYQGAVYNDSDVYKWVEAAAWLLASAPDPQMENRMEQVI